MEFSSQEYWNGLPFPSPEDLPDPGIKAGLTHCRQILYHLSHQIRYLHFIRNSVVLFAVEVRLKMHMVTLMKKFAGKKTTTTVIDLLREEIKWNHVTLKAEREEKEIKKYN